MNERELNDSDLSVIECLREIAHEATKAPDVRAGVEIGRPSAMRVVRLAHRAERLLGVREGPDE